MLDGHSLELKLSNRELPDTDGMKRKTVDGKEQGQSTKLIVRNLPFQVQKYRKFIKKLLIFRPKSKKLRIFSPHSGKFVQFGFRKKLAVEISIVALVLSIF